MWGPAEPNEHWDRPLPNQSAFKRYGGHQTRWPQRQLGDVLLVGVSVSPTGSRQELEDDSNHRISSWSGLLNTDDAAADRFGDGGGAVVPLPLRIEILHVHAGCIGADAER